jgi:hypothetical protein
MLGFGEKTNLKKSYKKRNLKLLLLQGQEKAQGFCNLE